jgi:hypothetical protein
MLLGKQHENKRVELSAITLRALAAGEAARPVTPQLSSERRRQSGQSAIIVVIVLFLMLFLGGIFIALIAGNLRSARTSTRTSASGRFAEAGINYLDQQLTNAPEGADWRPAPDCPEGTLPCVAISTQDPDYYWLQPYRYEPSLQEYVGGYTRVNFGGDVAGAGNMGGRALVRVTYRPDPPVNNTAAPPASAISRYIKLEAVGRAGVIDPRDPTTYKNGSSDSGQAAGQRVELVAYKAINLNEFVRQIVNKDNKPGPFTLGAINPVYDQPAAGGARANIATDPQPRLIESVYAGAVRVNGPLTFYGINRLILNEAQGDSLLVAGPISLHNVGERLNIPAANTDPTQVFVNNTTGVPNLVPSTSPLFTTQAPAVPGDPANAAGLVPGLVRDSPRGSESATLNDIDPANRNLRVVGRTQAPLIDAPIGPNGLTRYRAITRNSPPMANVHTNTNNVGVGTDYAGLIGWGENLYINNRNDVQLASETLAGRYSLRADWLSSGGGSGGESPYWKGESQYVPPAVTITLYPRYFTVTRSPYDTAQTRGSYTFRNPTTGQRIPSTKIVRYSYEAGGPITNAPATGFGLRDADKFAGYPAIRNADGIAGNEDDDYYSGDFVIFAEGNIRIRGVAGGLDPETGAFFKRNLTVVSNATIYVDGNLLRDNIPGTATGTGAAVRGKSSIALLAKDYVTVNTTQFLSPEVALFKPETNLDPAQDIDPEQPQSLTLSSSPAAGVKQTFDFQAIFGPADRTNQTPTYLQGGSPVSPSLFMRHGVGSNTDTAINVFVNSNALNTPNLLTFAPDPHIPVIGAPQQRLVLAQGGSGDAVYVNDRYNLDLTQLFVPEAGGNIYPYGATPPAVGAENFLTVNLDVSSGQAFGDYRLTRVGIAPLDVRIEALIYAQEGSFFIIPGPWFNPNRDDTYKHFREALLRDREQGLDPNNPQGRRRVEPRFPFYGEPMDIRITFFGQINENVSAEVGDQGAWMEKWGWVPRFYGSTGLDSAPGFTANPANPAQGTTLATIHGPEGGLADPSGSIPAGLGGNGIYFEYDPHGLTPYAETTIGSGIYAPIRRDPYRLGEPLPIAPRLPVAPGLLYYGQPTRLSQTYPVAPVIP